MEITRVKAVLVRAQDRLGVLAEALGLARDHGVDLKSVAAYVVDGQAVVTGVPTNFGLTHQLLSLTTFPIEAVDAFQVEGDDERGALCGVMSKLAAAGVSATGVHAAAIGGRFAGVVYVAPEDVKKAAEALGV